MRHPNALTIAPSLSLLLRWLFLDMGPIFPC